MVKSSKGAPKAAREQRTLGAFSISARTQISKSPVARGCPCTAIAYAPTNRKSAFASDNANNMSLKSWLNKIRLLECPRRKGQRPNHHYPLYQCCGMYTTITTLQFECRTFYNRSVHSRESRHNEGLMCWKLYAEQWFNSIACNCTRRNHFT